MADRQEATQHGITASCAHVCPGETALAWPCSRLPKPSAYLPPCLPSNLHGHPTRGTRAASWLPVKPRKLRKLRMWSTVVLVQVL